MRIDPNSRILTVKDKEAVCGFCKEKLGLPCFFCPDNQEAYHNKCFLHDEGRGGTCTVDCRGKHVPIRHTARRYFEHCDWKVSFIRTEEGVKDSKEKSLDDSEASEFLNLLKNARPMQRGEE